MIDLKEASITASVIKSFTQQNEDLIKSIFQLIYYYRGALSRDEAWALSHPERELAIEFLNGRFKEAVDLMKKQVPVFI